MDKNITPSKVNTTNDPTQLLSSTIDLLRFPLAIMVIFIHMNPQVVNLIDADFSLLSGHGIYNIVGIVGSHVLTHIAVPAFFLISGFLFFNNFKKWSWDIYRKKIKSRIKTLFIPYILWNLIPFSLVLLSMLAGVILKGTPIEGIEQLIEEKSWHIIYDCNEWDTTRINWLGDNLRMTGPYNLPLWFLRDLIVATLLTPIIYCAIKRLKIGVILILFVAYISRVWTLVPGFDITTIFYFSTGAYFALNELNMVSFARQYRYLFISLSIILLIVTTIYDGLYTVVGQNVYPFFVFNGVFTSFIIGSWCISRNIIMPNKFLVSCCFFIYALHGVGLPLIGTPLCWINSVLRIIIPGSTGFEEGICYIVAPFVTAFACIAVLTVGRRFFPKITLLFSGNK